MDRDWFMSAAAAKWVATAVVMRRSPAWQRLQARFGMKAEDGVHLGDYDGTCGSRLCYVYLLLDQSRLFYAVVCYSFSPLASRFWNPKAVSCQS